MKHTEKREGIGHSHHKLVPQAPCSADINYIRPSASTDLFLTLAPDRECCNPSVQSLQTTQQLLIPIYLAQVKVLILYLGDFSGKIVLLCCISKTYFLLSQAVSEQLQIQEKKQPIYCDNLYSPSTFIIFAALNGFSYILLLKNHFTSRIFLLLYYRHDKQRLVVSHRTNSQKTGIRLNHNVHNVTVL